MCTGLARPPPIDLDQENNSVITDIKENNIRLSVFVVQYFIYFPAEWVTLVVNFGFLNCPLEFKKNTFLSDVANIYFIRILDPHWKKDLDHSHEQWTMNISLRLTKILFEQSRIFKLLFFFAFLWTIQRSGNWYDPSFFPTV